MIDVRVGELAEAEVDALLRPVAADGSAVTPAMRRLERAAGPALEEQFRRLGELPVGSAAITGAGDLAAGFMVHVVVRSYDEPVSPAGVGRGLLNGLRRLDEWGIESVAVAPLGTGAGNLDAEQVAALMVPILTAHLAGGSSLARVVVVVESEYERDAFARELSRAAGEAAGAPAVPGDAGAAGDPPV